MATSPQEIIAPQQLTTSAATYYTVGANKKCVLRRITFTNPTASTRTVTAYIVPSGGSADATNIFLDTLSVAADTTVSSAHFEGHVLPAGTTIQLLTDSATSVVVRGSGTEVSV